MKLSIFLLVVLSVTVLCEDQRVTKFKTQHIIETNTGDSCDKLIKDRKIKDFNGKDKKKRNTFIFSTFKKVKDICKEEQRVYKNDNLYRSSEEMELLHCKLQYDKKKYEGVKIKKHIEIACDNNMPVHFQQWLLQVTLTLVLLRILLLMCCFCNWIPSKFASLLACLLATSALCHLPIERKKTMCTLP
uniref:Ribonuclease A-domain domain-containing protein n=1 Tax=Astatotilapia calliptera TaxID=8154 RepID=A0A3P8QFM6_ASTCA